VTWGSEQAIDPATGQTVTKWTQNTSLDPRLQSALDSQIGLQQGRSDLAGSMLGRVQGDLSTPMDYSQFTQMGGAPTATNTQGGRSAYSFGAPQLNTNLGAGAGQVQQGLDFSGTHGLSTAADQRQRSEDAAYQSQASRLDPRFAAQQRSMETDLANRGISRNSAAYTRAMDDFGRSKNDAYTQAQLGAIGIGGQEASRNYGMDLSTRQQQVGEIGQQGNFSNAAQAQMFGQGMQAGQANNAALGAQFGMNMQGNQFGMAQDQQNFGQNLAANNQNFQQQMQQSSYQNQLRQQQIAEAMQQRGMGLNEMNALLSGQQVGGPQFGNFNQAGQAQGADLMGAAQSQYGADSQAQSAKNAQQQQTMQAIGSMAAMFMFSDRRVKRDVKRIGTHPRGFGIYRYRYVGERAPRVGVMAQEVRRFMPRAVRVNSGVLMVDYKMINEARHV
jgi:hypothetical protein